MSWPVDHGKEPTFPLDRRCTIPATPMLGRASMTYATWLNFLFISTPSLDCSAEGLGLCCDQHRIVSHRRCVGSIRYYSHGSRRDTQNLLGMCNCREVVVFDLRSVLGCIRGDYSGQKERHTAPLGFQDFSVYNERRKSREQYFSSQSDSSNYKASSTA